MKNAFEACILSFRHFQTWCKCAFLGGIAFVAFTHIIKFSYPQSMFTIYNNKRRATYENFSKFTIKQTECRDRISFTLYEFTCNYKVSIDLIAWKIMTISRILKLIWIFLTINHRIHQNKIWTSSWLGSQTKLEA